MADKRSNPCCGFLRNNWRLFIAVLLPIALLPLPVLTSMEGRGLYVLIVMAVFWVTEAVPLAVTSLFPLVLGPTLGIKAAKDIAPNYFKDVVVLFMGGLLVAMCIERWKLHHRIALGVLMISGTTKRWLMLGIMLPTWFLSMWISNTATTTMMVPIVAAIMNNFQKTKKMASATGTENDVLVAETGVDEGDNLEKKDTETEDIHLEMQQQNNHDKTNKNGHILLTEEDEKKARKSQKAFEHFRKGTFLCVTYAAACGGVATLTGTPPNLVLAGQIEKLYKSSDLEITFQTWMVFGLPLSALTLILVWLWMCLYFIGPRGTFLGCGCSNDGIRAVIRKQFKALGPMTWGESVSLVLFILLVLLWLTRKSQHFTGWGVYIGDGKVGDSTSAMFIALLIMIIPSALPRCPGKKYTPLLEWTYTASNFPWGILLLLGGGFALADLCSASGVTTWMINQLALLKGIPIGVIILIVSVLVASVTEIASNTATANLVVPIMADLAVQLEVHPLYLMLPAVLSCSFAFMLPAATPPNAVVFSHGAVTVFDMIKAGFVLNIVCLLCLQLAVHTIGVALFDLNTYPAWANITSAAAP